MASLYQDLKVIANIPESIKSVDRLKECREVFEDYRWKGSLVDRVIEGETTFSAVAEDIKEEVAGENGAKVWYPSVSENFPDEYDKIWGFVPDGKGHTLLNPVSFGVPLLLLGLLGGKSLAGPNPRSRRDLLSWTGSCGAAGLVAGGGVGWVPSVESVKWLRRIKAYSEWMDSLVELVYRS